MGYPRGGLEHDAQTSRSMTLGPSAAGCARGRGGSPSRARCVPSRGPVASTTTTATSGHAPGRWGPARVYGVLRRGSRRFERPSSTPTATARSTTPRRTRSARGSPPRSPPRSTSRSMARPQPVHWSRRRRDGHAERSRRLVLGRSRRVPVPRAAAAAAPRPSSAISFVLARPGETEVKVEDSPGVTIHARARRRRERPDPRLPVRGPGRPVSDDGLELAFVAGDDSVVADDGLCPAPPSPRRGGAVVVIACVVGALGLGAAWLVARRRRA